MKLIIPLFALSMAAAAFAQDTVKFYRLDFTVKELDGSKVVSAKKYSTVNSTDPRARGALIRTGTKIPYTTAAGGTGPATSIQYAEIGVNIDCHSMKEESGQLILHIAAEISSVTSSAGPINVLPVIRQYRWSSLSVVEPGKPTTLYSSDDVDLTRKMQLELTATPVR